MQRTHSLKDTHPPIRVLPCLHCRSEKGKPCLRTPNVSELVMPLPHTLSPKHERQQRPRDSKESLIGESELNSTKVPKSCSRPCGVAQRSCAGAGPIPRAGTQLPVDCVLLLGGGVWCCYGSATHTSHLPVGGGLKSAADLIDVRLEVGSLPPRSSSPTVTGCWLGGFSVFGRCLSDVSCVVDSLFWEGCYPALALAHWVCVIVYV
jgi:hypothetical protein